VFGYSLALTEGVEGMNAYIGSLSKAMLSGVNNGTVNPLAATIPEWVFITFQMTFAIITPALITGAFAERMKFSALMWFIGLWLIFCYVPIAHWVWGGGFLGGAGVLDFAGGTVVHINAGIAGLVACIIIGKRKGFGSANLAPHNLTWSLIGASLLWVGWFGFNAGSALGANALAGAAMVNTQVATAAAALAWMFCEWIVIKKPSLLGILSGAIAGLVAITPAAGFVNPTGALIIGILAGIGCYVAAVPIKRALGYDDSLDVFGVHGVGGIIGAILTGVFADAAINELGKDASVAAQVYGVAVTIIYTAIVTAIILYIIKAVIGLRPTASEEEEGLDIALHGETVQH
jgi:Amt family ammonium transporter